MSARFQPDFTLAQERAIYYHGIELFNAGDFFEAHDAWEEAWHQVQHGLRERFYRGLIQSAVTLELLRRGRAIGVRQVYLSCSELLGGVPPVFMGLDVMGHLASVRRAIEPVLSDLSLTQIQIDPARLFVIKLVYDPFAESLHGEECDCK